MKFNITNAGLNILLRGLSGETITFDHVEIGNGDSQTAAAATALNNSLMSLDITEITSGTNTVTLECVLANSTVTAGFRHTETGVFVKDIDDPSQTVMYAYGFEDESTADYIGSATDNVLETKMSFIIFVGEAQNVTAAINESLIYVSKEEFDSHKDNLSNPHQVTKSQVGLSNVPNVTTNDQTPTYTEPSALQNLTSGEKLNLAFGKISKAVRNFVSHFTNKNNPHEVTADQVGAASKTHKHSTADLTSGILSVQRGGTGKDSLTAFINALYAAGLNHDCYEKVNLPAHTTDIRGYIESLGEGKWYYDEAHYDSSSVGHEHMYCVDIQNTGLNGDAVNFYREIYYYSVDNTEITLIIAVYEMSSRTHQGVQNRRDLIEFHLTSDGTSTLKVGGKTVQTVP